MRSCLFITIFLSIPVTLCADDQLPVVFADDFESGMSHWQPTDVSKWKITAEADNHVFHLLGGSVYEPPHRSPLNFALLKDVSLGDFVITVKVKTLQTSRAHRDMCLFFGYQDPAHYYYVHLGQATDPHANQIFIVNEADRIKISEKTNAGTPWKDDTWHNVKLVRNIADGLIEVYFDDMQHPQMVAHDQHFQWGQVGLGSFDDLGQWDDFELRGQRVDKSSAPTSKN